VPVAIASNALYGSDKSGLIFGYLFEPNASGRPVNGGEAVKWLAHERERRTGGFLWLHYDLANVATEKWLLEHLELSSAFFEAVHEGSRATRIDYADGALVAIVNDVLYNFSFEATDISTLWVCADERLVVSARRKPLRSVDRLRASVRNGESLGSSVELMVHLLRDQADVLVQIVRTAMTQVDDIEDSLLAGRLDHKRVNLGALRRVLVRLQRVLAPEPAALFRLLNRPPAWVADSDLQELRHSTEEFSAVLSDVAVLLERIKLLQEEMTSQINQQNKRSLFLLTVFTVLALPINIIAGLFGMNVGGVPLAQSDQGFWIIVGLVAAFTLAALWIVFRRQRD
jgi:zinc transporter